METMESQLYIYFIEFCISIAIMIIALLFIILVKYYIRASRGLTNSVVLCILMLVAMVILMPSSETVVNMMEYFNN